MKKLPSDLERYLESRTKTTKKAAGVPKIRPLKERQARPVAVPPVPFPDYRDYPEMPDYWAPLKETQMPPIKGLQLPRVVHWRDPRGKYVVVSGPFPYGMFRSETRKVLEKAIMSDPGYMTSRPETTNEDYAKVLATDIMEIDSGENEFGPVSP